MQHRDKDARSHESCVTTQPEHVMTIAAPDEVFTERTCVSLNTEEWTAFMASLDAPPRWHPRMERLLTEPSLLD